MMIGRRVLLAAAAGLLLAAPHMAQAASLKIHGSTTVFANLFQDHQTEVESLSGQTLEIVSNGSSRGLGDLASGTADMGMISAPLDVTIAKIQKKNANFDASGFAGHLIGESAAAFIVHPSNPVKSLTNAQIAAILRGEVTNWAELGGNPMPIKIVMETQGGGVRSMASKGMINGDPITTAGSTEVPNATQVPKIVAQMPMAFGIAASAAAKGKPVAILGGHTAPSQPLILVTKGEPSDAQQAVIGAARGILGSR